MRVALEDMFSREVANLIKMDSNDMEEKVGVDLVSMVEEGVICVVGIKDGKLLYLAAESVDLTKVMTNVEAKTVQA